MNIRPAAEIDVDAVLALWRAAEVVPSATDDAAGVGRVIADGTLLVAEDVDGVIVGSVIAGFDDWRGNLYRLAVVPEHRRRGVATALVRAGEATLADCGCRRITALVVATEHHATAFWI